jgi:AAA15 family ATPase/GTPase
MEEWVKPLQVVGTSDSAAAPMMAEYLRNIDVPVVKIDFERINDDGKNIGARSTMDELKHAIRNYDYRTTFTHETTLGRAEFDIAEESKGTRNLLAFFLPWSVKADQVVLVDEFDSSLHPKLVAALVAKHLNGGSGSQLIFTTHDTHLMDTKMLRRDQFWLTERDPYGATQLRSIHDFEGREGEDIEKRYYEGRYRSLPILSEA